MCGIDCAHRFISAGRPKCRIPAPCALLDTIDHGGLVLQLDGSALIFSPRLAKLCCLTDDLLAGGERFARS